MKWLAIFAKTLLRRLAFRSRASTAPAAIPAAYGPAPLTSPTPRPDGASTSTRVLIARRAMKRCNRNRKAASRFERVHLVLDQGLK